MTFAEQSEEPAEEKAEVVLGGKKNKNPSINQSSPWKPVLHLGRRGVVCV